MRRYVYLLFIIVTVVIAGFVGCNSLQNSPPEHAHHPDEADSKFVQIALKPLDDAGNPYRNDYDQWDEWVYARVLEAEGKVQVMAEHTSLNHTKQAAAGQRMTTCGFTIDPAGYLVPAVVETRKYEENINRGASNALSEDSQVYLVSGEMQESLAASMQRAFVECRGKYYPTIPDWLMVDPPALATLLPDGDVICRGALGSGASRQASHGNVAGLHSMLPADLHRYNAAGELLASSENSWWKLFQPTTPEPSGKMLMDEAGHITYVDETTGKVLSKWDYDCTPLSSSAATASRDSRHFQSLNPDLIVNFYNGQNRPYGE